MQHDDLIWQVIHHGHCSFKAKCVAVETGQQASFNVCALPLTRARHVASLGALAL